MFASEFGQNTLDELNVIAPGRNYGWPDREGTDGASNPSFTDPIATWTTAQASPSGIAVTREGVYIAALRGQRLWRVPFAGVAPIGTEGTDAATGSGTGTGTSTGTTGTATTDSDIPSAFGAPQEVLSGYGRLRTVFVDPANPPSTNGDAVLYALTNNTDGRGDPGPDDDVLLRLTITAG